jgi:chaperonin GroEL (HSP60 family)
MILIYRDAVSDLALHFLAKMKILVVKDIEREEIEFVCKVSHSNKIVIELTSIIYLNYFNMQFTKALFISSI